MNELLINSNIIENPSKMNTRTEYNLISNLALIGNGLRNEDEIMITSSIWHFFAKKNITQEVADMHFSVTINEGHEETVKYRHFNTRIIKVKTYLKEYVIVNTIGTEDLKLNHEQSLPEKSDSPSSLFKS